VPASVFDRAWLVMSLGELGRFAEAAKYEEEAFRIAEPTEHAFTMGWAHFGASVPHLLKGDWGKARSQIEHWITRIRTGNVGIHLPWAVASSAWGLAQIGEASAALARMQEAEQLLGWQMALGIVGHGGWAYHAAGRAALLLGRLSDAQRLAKRAIEATQRQPGFRAHALHLLGDIASHPETFAPDTAKAHYREALTLAQQHGMRPLTAHCHLGLGTLHHRTGRPGGGRDHLAAATTMYRDMDMGYWLKQAQL
jgi:tetratricopeptide (TPR) repeat protein